MAKRKTIQTMNFAERVAVRKEMIEQAESMLRQRYPAMTRGAVRVKAFKFVEDSLAKEFQHENEGSNAKRATIQ